MTLVLDTIAPTTLAALYGTWTVEASVKAASGFATETLRDMYRVAPNDKIKFMIVQGAALRAEREAAEALAYAPAEAHAAAGCRTSCSFPGPACTGLVASNWRQR